MDLGNVIRQKRSEKGLTQTDLAKHAGISQGSISMIEKGVISPSRENLRAISEVLGINEFLLYYLALTEDSIEADKRELYRLLKPALDDLIHKIM